MHISLRWRRVCSCLLKKIKHYFSLDTLRILINAAVVSSLNYCNYLVYGIPNCVLYITENSKFFSEGGWLLVPKNMSTLFLI